AHVIGDEKVQVAVAIVVPESRPSGPSAITDASLFSNVAESSIPVVMVKVVSFQAREVKIFVTVAVEIRRDDSHGPTRIGHTRTLRHVRKGAVAIVTIESAPGASGTVGGIHREGVGEVNIKATVVVIVEERDTTAHRLDNVLLLGCRVVLEVDPGSVGDVYKADGRRLIRRCNGSRFEPVANDCSRGGIPQKFPHYVRTLNSARRVKPLIEAFFMRLACQSTI